MEPNKLENQIRKELHSREIQPSDQAWNRLDAMLSAAEDKKTRLTFGFLSRKLGIAASIMVFLTVGVFLSIQKSYQIQQLNNVVETEVKKDTLINKPNTKFQIQFISDEKVTESSDKNPTKNNQQLSANNQENSINNKTQSINQNKIIKGETLELVYISDVGLKDLPKIVTSSENIIERKKSPISDDYLLAVLDTAAKQNINKQKKVKVDAEKLLSQVDGKLELTFRERVIKKVSKKYKEVKVALENRNNE